MTTDNRTNEPTEAQIEAAAKAYPRWIVDHDGPEIPWEQEPEALKREYRHMMRAALVAAQEAAPVPSSGVDEETIVEVIGSLGWGYMVDGPSVSEIARAVVAYLRGES